ncbi:MAG: sugar ABC transporter permease [Anaerolineaceae bacterium]|nr:MAG: sugar ABC transporter permease [Anaerolineaceae bacterium]
MPLYLMLIPAIIIIFIYCYIPMAGNIIAFQKFSAAKGLFSSKQTWVGLDNFKYIFSMKNTHQVIYNTIFISFFKIILSIIVPLIVALLLNEVTKTWYKRTVQTIVYFPYFISWVILSGILFDILSPSTGIVNSILSVFNIDPIYFLGNENTFPWVVIISDTWKNYGFNTILYLTAITSVSQELYESAAIDGAGILKRMWNVTIPGILPIIILVSVLSLGNILNAGFEQVFNLATPTVYSTGDIIDTLVYRMSIGASGGASQYSAATAIGLFKSFISFIMISIGYYLAKRYADYRVF